MADEDGFTEIGFPEGADNEAGKDADKPAEAVRKPRILEPAPSKPAIVSVTRPTEMPEVARHWATRDIEPMERIPAPAQLEGESREALVENALRLHEAREAEKPKGFLSRLKGAFFK
ncbi:MAG: hypothetical protein WC607_00490 [Candidatus Micrarchaeia archaeon]